MPRKREDRPGQWVDRDDLVDDWNKYFELFTWAPIAYALLDLKGIVCEINEAAVMLLGSAIKGIVGHPLLIFVVSEDRPRMLEHFRRVRASAATIQEEFTFRSRDDRQLNLLLSTRRSPRLGEHTCWMVMEDVTERHRLVAEQRAAEARRLEAEHEQITYRLRSEAKDQFLATLSHELRTPLTPALLASSLLPRIESLSPKGEEMVATIRRNIEMEARLIDDLLDVTRIAEGKMHLERSEVDVREALQESLAAFGPDAAARRITVTFDPAAAISRVHGDPVRLRQVFWNLLKNAIKFTEPGGSVRVATEDVAPGRLRVSVADTGIGINPAMLPIIFRPFDQAVTAGKHGGLGLGLAICHGIIAAHGGHIQGRSDGEGQGATFEVELPTLGIRTPATPRSTGIDGQPVRGLRILLVEDHADSAEMLAALLGGQGHTVEIATTMAAGIAKLDDGWDCLISDLGLPDGSGLEIGRRLGGLRHRPPVCIALSGYGTSRDGAASREAGFDVHLVKPAPIDELKKWLGRIK